MVTLRRGRCRQALALTSLLWPLAIASGADSGQLLPDVRCISDARQGYALYLPPGYSEQRDWPVIFVFDPGARGLSGIQHYREAAERYGYIVAGSNNSRNGQDNSAAVVAMMRDVIGRQHVDPRRMYTAGMSGGARVAMSVALLPKVGIAGVIASSAAWPDGKTRRKLPFVVFATAGSEDFNHLEMRQLDRELQTPHRLRLFDGGHRWPSSEIMVEAVEWLEVQAMQAGIRARDPQELNALFARRMAAIGDAHDAQALLALRNVMEDFKGLRDLGAVSARADALGRDNAIGRDIDAQRQIDDSEFRTLREIWLLEDQLADRTGHAQALAELRHRWQRLAEQSGQAADSDQRRLARRIVSNLAATVRSQDPDYLQLVREFRASRVANTMQ
jgi:predicted esterase